MVLAALVSSRAQPYRGIDMKSYKFNMPSVFLVLFFLLIPLSYAQVSDGILTDDDGTFWTLPFAECSGGNRCQIRVSPEGTIYYWDMVNLLLYVSKQNETSFITHDLTTHRQKLLRAIDFVPFEASEYVAFYSPVGGSRAITRYDLTSQSAEVMQFPDGLNLVGCNLSSERINSS